MTVTTERERIAAIGETITGLTTAYPRPPRSIPSASLPALVVLTGEAQRQRQDNMIMITRRYRLALLVLPWAQGIEAEAEELSEPFYARFEDAFCSRPSLQLTDNTTRLAGVQDSDLGMDTSTINIELAGVGYAGVIFDLLVQTVRVITRGT